MALVTLGEGGGGATNRSAANKNAAARLARGAFWTVSLQQEAGRVRKPVSSEDRLASSDGFDVAAAQADIG